MARTTPAFLQRPLTDQAGDPLRMFLMGANANRISYQKDPRTGIWLPGVPQEPARRNLCIHSEKIDDVVYVKTRCSPTNTSTTIAPDGVTTVNDVFHEDGTTSSTHHIYQSIACANDTYCRSFFAKAINRSWLAVKLPPDDCYFNLGAGVVGSKEGSIIDHGMEPWGNDWYRCWATRLMAAGAQLFYYIASTGDGAGFQTFNGLDQDSYFIWGGDLELGLYPSSYIKTEAGTVERTADGNVIMENNYLTDRATVLFPVLIPEHAPAADTGIVHLRDTAAGNYLSIGVKATTGVLRVQMKPSGGAATILDHSINICDGVLHWIAASVIRGGMLVIWVDGVPAAMQTLDNFPGEACDEAWLVGNNALGPWIGGLHVWPKFVQRMPRPVQPQLLAT